MPHKHSRREKDLSTFDLPPSQVARPLPVNSISNKNQQNQKNQKNQKGRKDQKNKPQSKKDDQQGKDKGLKRKRGDTGYDDAPRAFKRLMAFTNGKPPRSKPDDGQPPRKGKKAGKADAVVAGTEGAEDIPTIRPGERLSDFGARVNAALPVSGLIHKRTGKNDPLGLKAQRTRKEKKMHKLYDQWREEERKIKEQREEELELAEERELEDEKLGVKWKMDLEDAASRKKKKKGKRGKYIGEAAEKEEDPWEEIKRKRGEAKVGLHDVVSAPPELKPIKAKFTVRGAAVDVQDIPKAAGSLRRREELQGMRDEVVASYRRLMEKKRSTPAG